jgi:hypothetical protein
MGAILNGTLADDGGLVCDVRFQWGPTVAMAINTPWLGDGATVYRTGMVFSQYISGLAGNTVYYFRAQARNIIGTVSGAMLSFVTTAGDAVIVTTLPATYITEYSAVLNGLLVDDLRQTCEGRFLFGSTLAYGQTTEWQGGLTAGTTFNVAIAGLAEGIAYHVAAEARTPGGVIYRGNDIVFTTLSLEKAVFVGDEIYQLVLGK